MASAPPAPAPAARTASSHSGISRLIFRPKSRAGIGSASMPRLSAGVTQLSFGGAASGMPYVSDGQAWLIAVASQKRCPLYPDVPAIGEALPGHDGPEWVGLVVPQGTPQQVATASPSPPATP